MTLKRVRRPSSYARSSAMIEASKRHWWAARTSFVFWTPISELFFWMFVDRVPRAGRLILLSLWPHVAYCTTKLIHRTNRDSRMWKRVCYLRRQERERFPCETWWEEWKDMRGRRNHENHWHSSSFHELRVYHELFIFHPYRVDFETRLTLTSQ